MTNYEVITNTIIEKLKEGVIPWKMPYRNHREANANWLSKKPYHGINALLTSMMGKRSPFWLTFNQMKKIPGATIPKGTKGCPILFAKTIDYVDTDDNTRTKSIYRRSYVYNLQDITGIDCPIMEEIASGADAAEEFNPIEDCELLLETIKHNHAKIGLNDNMIGCYIPSLDIIKMPAVEDFVSEPEYYATLFHEIIHSTGHESRLKRTFGFSKKSPNYAKEELIAEIGASFLCADSNIIDQTVVNSTAYIAGWIKNLSKDPSMIVTAASQAEKAMKYLKSNDNGTTRRVSGKDKTVSAVLSR